MSSDEAASVAQRSFLICNLFESEILVWLLLRNWNHPLAEDEEYRSNLLEAATSVLDAAATPGCTEVFISELPARDMNLIAAIWYAESCALQQPDSTKNANQRQLRKEWLNHIRKFLPSCFCPADDLTP